MERLKKIIEQYGRWSLLSTYADRIEAHISTDFSHALENAKALLETIGKEICSSKGITLESTASINSVLKKSFSAIGYTGSDMVTQISSALATIGQQIGGLRNEIGPTAHGKSLDEMRERNSRIDEFTKELLIDTTIVIAVFLIRAFENEMPRVPPKTEETTILYTDNEEFNESWDESYGEFEMGEYSYPASEILYYVDYSAYELEHQAYTEAEKETP